MARRHKQQKTSSPLANVPEPRGTTPRAARLPAPRLATIVILAVFVIAYLARFVVGGGLRGVLYEVLLKKYVLLPDEVLAEIWSRWTWGSAGDLALLDRVPILLVATILLLCAWGIGRALLPRSAVARLNRLETHLFALAIGLNVWSLYTLALGLAGALHAVWLLRLPMLVGLAAGVARQWREACRQPVREPVASVPTSGERRALVYFAVLAVPFVLLYVLTAALPPWEFDVREYHLQTPKEWFIAGRIDFVPHNVYGNMPLGAEMHALAAMMWMSGPDAWWWGALAGKVVIAAYGLLTALALLAFGRRYFSYRAGAIAGLAYLTLPWTFHVSTNGLIEGPLALYLWTSVYGVCLAWPDFARPVAARWTADRDEVLGLADRPQIADVSPVVYDAQPSDTRGGSALLAISGFLAGAAVATKYPGLVFVAIPLTLAVTVRLGRRHLATLVLFVGMIAAGCGLWLAKNAVLTGNPTFPLLYSVFGGRGWTPEKDERWQSAHGPQPDALGRRYTPALLRSSLDNLLWNSDKLSPLLVPLAVWAVLVTRRRRLLLALAGLLVFDFLIWWLLTHRYDRFFLPLFPVVALFAGVGADWTQSRAWQWLVYVLVGWASIMNLLVLGMGSLTGDNRILVPLEILRTEPTGLRRVHPAHLYLNAHVPPGSAALLVGEAQPFDIDVPVYWSTCWDDCWLEIWTKGRTREQRLAAFRRHSISHVFIHWHEIDRYRLPRNYGFTGYVTRELVHEELVQQQRLLRPVVVPDGEGQLHPHSGEVFEVNYD